MTDGTGRGAVVLVHGLNTRPSVMADLQAVLERQGRACASVSLHDEPSTGRRPDAVVDGWLAAVADARRALAAAHPGRPVDVVGYSLGGLLGLLELTAHPDPGPARAVLWAPPLALTGYAGTVRLLAPAHASGLRVPSATPASARARRATPLVDYAALLRLADRVSALPRGDLLRLPALVLLEPRDPLVSDRGVRRWVARRRLDAWTVVGIGDRAPAGRTALHLVVSRDVLGPASWDAATRAMTAHLDRGSGG